MAIINYLVNFGLFYGVWIICLYGVVDGAAWWGPAATLGTLFIYLVLERHRWKEDIIIFNSLLAVGLLHDSLMASSGFIQYRGYLWLPTFLCPEWILGIWGLFALTLNRSMVWMRRYPPLAFLCGAFGGVLSYLAGERVGVIEFPFSYLTSIICLGLIWGLLFPLLLWYAHYVELLLSPENPKTK